MSHLSTALQQALAASGLTQTKLSQASGVLLSQVNRATRGTGKLNRDSIQRLSCALPMEHQGAVLAGWLKDQLKPAALAQVEIYALTTRTGEQPARPDLPDGLDDETRSLIIWLANQALTHTAVADSLRSLKRAATARRWPRPHAAHTPAAVASNDTPNDKDLAQRALDSE